MIPNAGPSGPAFSFFGLALRGVSNLAGNPAQTGRSDRRQIWEMGQTMGTVILVGSMVATVGVTAYIAGPRLVRGEADDMDDPAIAHLSDDQRHVLDGVVEMIGRSHEVLAIHGRGANPHTRIVLWLEDGGNPGVLDPGEVGVLTHSPALQTISFDAFEGNEAPEVDMTTVRDPGFARQWRACEGVRSRLIAREVSELRVTPTSGPDSSFRLRISLTWVDETSDCPDKASTVVDARGPAAVSGRSER
ncbi:MAG: hypothetical protein ACYTGR_05825 [Planctomycetota bacterium]